MISYPIRVLQESGLFDRIIVSTDDRAIRDVALAEGAEVPFIRPTELSDDYTGTGAVINHAIEWLMDDGQKPEYICCVYATTPFLTVENLRKGWQALNEGWRLAFAVTSYAFPIQRAIRMLDSGGVEPFFPEYVPKRSQDLEPAYHDAGQFYWGEADAFLEQISMFSPAAAPVVLERHFVQDIDDEEDWVLAERMYRAHHIS
jgi:N-acylneuraminate cytidylyltransferase